MLKGGAHNDQLFGGSGDDRLEGGSGNDLLNGGSGTDTVVYAGSGAVSVNLWLGTASGAWGTDSLVGIERVETGSGNDIVFGSFGGNRLTTGGGNDTVYALDGHDVVYAGSGPDTVYGYEGNDLIYASTGNDRVYGDDGLDTIHGEDGQDLVSGDAGNDVLYGGAGSDKLRGGDGLDTINGGSGPDIIAWGQGDSGLDTIAGFNLNEDRFSFEAGYFATNAVGPLILEDFLFVSDSGPNAILWANTAENGWINIATLLNVDSSTLDDMIDDGSILAPPAVNLGDLLRLRRRAPAPRSKWLGPRRPVEGQAAQPGRPRSYLISQSNRLAALEIGEGENATLHLRPLWEKVARCPERSEGRRDG